MPERGTTTNRAQRLCLRGVWTYMKKNSKMPVHCTAHHHHQLGFFSTPTPITDSGAVWFLATACHTLPHIILGKFDQVR
jgi:hypothetical protein